MCCQSNCSFIGNPTHFLLAFDIFSQFSQFHYKISMCDLLLLMLCFLNIHVFHQFWKFLPLHFSILPLYCSLYSLLLQASVRNMLDLFVLFSIFLTLAFIFSISFSFCAVFSDFFSSILHLFFLQLCLICYLIRSLSFLYNYKFFSFLQFLNLERL